MRNVQHKKEAFWFYRFLSIFYDDYVNPFFWTERMRAESLALGRFDSRDLLTIDVGSGTGFTTEGIVQRVSAENVTCIDQSPHQMAKAKAKPALQACTFQLGDAEDIPFPTDHFDRYVSAGSIEYWPEPERGIAEAYRVLKPGGVALMIGPLRPKNPFARWVADTWMLFPEEEAYVRWFEQAGFTDIQMTFSRPSWVAEEKYGIAIAGVKPAAGPSPLPLPARKREDVTEPMSLRRRVAFATRLLVGTSIGGLFVPMALVGYANQWLRKLAGANVDLDPLTPQQKTALTAIAAVGVAAWWRGRKRGTA